MNQLIGLTVDQKRLIKELSKKNQSLMMENTALRDELEVFQKKSMLKNEASIFKGSNIDASKTKDQLSQLIVKVDRCIEDFSKIMYQSVA